MSGGGTTQSTVQNKDPWAPTQPYLQQIMSQGQNLYNSGAGSQTWGGALIAPQSAQTQMGINALTGAAANQAGSAITLRSVHTVVSALARTASIPEASLAMSHLRQASQRHRAKI